MLRIFQTDLFDQERFIITLELVPGRESFGRTVDTVRGIANDSFADGRISAVSITDNPGGNPSLSPDVIGHEVFGVGMDVIVHFACRDMNRAGMESRALQLAMMGMKNILALTGDYTSKAFGGQGAPVFDLDSVNLIIMLNLLNERANASGDPDGFFTGAAISPFKYTEGESFAQYAKLCRKAAAGARFIITQLGYDARKFREMCQMQRWLGIDLPVIGSVYLLSPRAAKAMNKGAVPGVVVPDKLLAKVLKEWRDPQEGLRMAIERTARLASVLKGLNYRGIQIGGIHRSFKTVARILDRMEEIERDWREFIGEFDYYPEKGFFAFSENFDDADSPPAYNKDSDRLPAGEGAHFKFLQTLHDYFFNMESPLTPFLEKCSKTLDRNRYGRSLAMFMESVPKKLLLDCRKCGDCGIQHVAFLCPESKCPKHIRNGACGGSKDGRCEVYPDRKCVWYRAYQRWASVNHLDRMVSRCVPPRMWELDSTASWLNFHLKRDHQSASNRIAQFCRKRVCHLPRDFGQIKRE
jgi:methylenetetrahydrofolate reductase (NADPH)